MMSRYKIYLHNYDFILLKCIVTGLYYIVFACTNIISVWHLKQTNKRVVMKIVEFISLRGTTKCRIIDVDRDT